MGTFNSGYGVGAGRPRISFVSGEYLHNGLKVRVAMRHDVISVGCTDVTVEALRQLLKDHDSRFGNQEIVVQP